MSHLDVFLSNLLHVMLPWQEGWTRASPEVLSDSNASVKVNGLLLNQRVTCHLLMSCGSLLIRLPRQQ